MADSESSRDQMIIEQYKAFIGDVGNIGQRYATSNGFYATLVAGLVALLGLTEPGKALGKFAWVVQLSICFFALVLCWIWWETVHYFRQLFRAKFTVLRD